MTMLSEVVNAAKQVLHADRGSVWLYDAAADELVLEIATGIRPGASSDQRRYRRRVRRSRRIINVPDCYADPRFNPDVDSAPAIGRAACSLCRSSITRTCWSA